MAASLEMREPKLAEDSQKPQVPSPPPTPPGELILHPYSEINFYSDADLILEAFNSKKQPIHLHVASTALCIASPVFRAMLSRHRFREGVSLHASSLAGKLFTLTLPDDEPDSLAILCHILHHNHHKVPRGISVETLAKLCILLDKYVCCLAVVSWIDYWFGHMPALHPESSAGHGNRDEPLPEVYVTDSMWLWISLVVGDRERFRYYSSRYIMHAPAFEMMDDKHREWFDRLPESIQEALLQANQDAIQNVLNLVADFCTGMGKQNTMCLVSVSGTVESPPNSPSRRSNVMTSKDCDALSIGRLVQALQDHGLSPSPFPLVIASSRDTGREANGWTKSIEELLERLEEVGKELTGGTRMAIQPHGHCGQGRIFQRKVKELRCRLWKEGLDLMEFRGGHKSK